MNIAKPYLLFLGDAPDDLAAKTAIGILEWRPSDCVGQLALPGCRADLGIDSLDIATAIERGARTLVIGVANRGGVISDAWSSTIIEALESGLDVASGLHSRLSDVDTIRETATKHGRQLIDVRHPATRFEVGTGLPRSGHRLLTVGTDCSVGKMYAALAIEKAMRDQGFRVDFRATGQTGILIAGSGVPVDAVVADFISGAVESLSPANEEDHWDVIEGQGSLFHPSFAGVSLGLLHGAQPDVLVLCHEPTRTHMRGLAHQSLPGLQECLDTNLAAAHLVSREVRCVGVAINTRALSETDAERLIKSTEDEIALPCTDPVRFGADNLIRTLK